MTESEWGNLEAQFVTRLRGEKVEPVPEPIVKLAQLSLEGQDSGVRDGDGNPVILHAMQREFETVERAIAFERHMRNAGKHTNPVSSITVVRDPDRGRVPKLDANGQPVVSDTGRAVTEPGPEVNPRLVAWRAGSKRGRASV